MGHGHVLVAGALALAMSMRGITALPLSVDEFYSLHAVTQGLGAHTWELPLLPYYAMLWVWTFGGHVTTDLWLRALSVGAVAVAAMSVAATAYRIRSQKAGYLAALLFASVAAMQQFAQTARPYAVGTAFAGLATYLLVRATQSPARRRWWVGYCIAILVGTIVMPQSLVVVVAHGVYVSGSRDWRCVRRWLLSLAGLVPVAVLGLLLMVRGTYAGMHEWLGAPGVQQIPSTLLLIGDATAVPVAATAAFGFALVVIGLMTREGMLLVFGAVASALAVWSVSVLLTSFWIAGTFLPLVTLVVVAAASSLATFERRTLWPIVLALLVVAIPAYTSVRLPRSGEADMRLVASIIDAGVERSSILAGDPTDAYGLGPTMARYGRASVAWMQSLRPTGDYWALYGPFECEAIESWDVGGNATLRLCPAPNATAESSSSKDRELSPAQG